MSLLLEGARGGRVRLCCGAKKKFISYLILDVRLLRVDVWEKKWVKEGSTRAALSPQLMGALPSRDSVVSLFTYLSLSWGI